MALIGDFQQAHRHYRPQQSCENYVFTPVCYSVHRGGLPQCKLGYHTPGTRHPPGAGTPPWSRHPPDQTPPVPAPLGPAPLGADPPSGDGYCCGRYASYWNAFLFYLLIFQHNSMSQLLCTGFICINSTKIFIPVHDSINVKFTPYLVMYQLLFFVSARGLVSEHIQEF